MPEISIARKVFFRKEDAIGGETSIDDQFVDFLQELVDSGKTLISAQQTHEQRVDPRDRRTYTKYREYLIIWTREEHQEQQVSGTGIEMIVGAKYKTTTGNIVTIDRTSGTFLSVNRPIAFISQGGSMFDEKGKNLLFPGDDIIKRVRSFLPF